ncbi:MAG: CinA family nicotinamide mononucleotide deamidase-related protein [Thermodesulfobacteriota bacterium]
MKGEIIAIGDELTSGRILNTTSSFAAGHLYGAGHDIIAMSTIGDDPAAIETALLRALKRADFLIITGGLGATSDDMTNEAVGRVLGRPPTFYPEIFARICGAGGSLPESLCPLGGRPAPDHNHPLEKLAWLPEGSSVLKPEARMAGHLLVHEGVPIFFLPGVPNEMKELMLDCVLPYLAAWQGRESRRVRQRIYKVFGLPEIEINRRLRDIERASPLIRIGYYPVFPEVHVSLTVFDEDGGDIDGRFAAMEREVAVRLADCLYGVDDDTMEQVVGRLLLERGLTLATAESCTGGLVASRIVRVPGSSRYYSGGVVAYSNPLKEKLLGVAQTMLAAHGAVSGEVAAAMAEGARAACNADLAVAVTGVAGPGGGTADKPVGLVYLACAGSTTTTVVRRLFAGDRRQIQKITTMTALDLVRRTLQGETVA